jgi:VWFA-related protein
MLNRTLMKGRRGLACALLLTAVAMPLTAQSSAPQSRLDGFWQEWLDQTGPLLAEEERLFFRILETDLEREAFVEAFWRSRGSGALERWSRNRADAWRMRSLSPWRERAVMLAGKPDSILRYERCGPLRSLELWEWRVRRLTAGADTSRGFRQMLFAEGSTLDKRSFRPWDPEDPESLSRGSVGYSTTEALLASLESGGCFSSGKLERLSEALEESMAFEELERLAAWPRPDTSWLRELSGAEAEAGGPRFDAELVESFLGRYTRFTILEGKLRIAVDRLNQLSSGRLFDRIVVIGDVIRGGRLVDTFEVVHLIAGATPAETIDLSFYRRLLPGKQTLRLRVADRHGLALLRVDRILDVPRLEEAAPAPPGFAFGYSHLTREQVVQLHTFPDVELLPVVAKGTTRAQVVAATTGGPIAAVEFQRDGDRVETDREAPYSSSIEIGPEGNDISAVALDPSGLPLARHERRIEREGPPFAVRFGRVQDGESRSTVEVRIALPDGESVAAVECFHARRLISRPAGPSYRCPVPAADAALDYMTVRVTLEGGDVQEDVLFLGPRSPEEVDVRLVEFYVSVFDGSGRPQLGLTASDFRVREDGEERPLERVEPMENLPLSVTVLLDVSSSMGRGIATASASAQTFFESVLTEGDQASLLAFNHDLHVLAPFTPEVEELRHAATGLGAWGATRLYDAVVYALAQYSGVEGRRALIVLSDGADVGSDFPFAQVVEAAARAGVVVYPIAVARSDEPLRDDLRVLARRTGGRAYAIGSVGQLDSVYRQIEEELRAQYLLVYRPARPVDFEPLDLAVELTRPGLTTRELRRHN